jgi:hypothetical protein
MPLEPDDLRISPDQEKLNRQLEALQRFVSDLQQQRDQAEAAAQSSPGPEPRPSRRWLARSPGPMIGRLALRRAPPMARR